jgi:pimeloyl-ACP methyl ester carboxylesterase
MQGSDLAPELSIQTLGDPGKPALLLLHGMLSSNLQWCHNTAALADSHFLVMAELWGHGNSSVPGDEYWFSAAGLSEQIENTRQRLGITSWSLAGHSFGAAVMLSYALVYPAVIDAVAFTNSRAVLGQSMPPPDENQQQAIREYGVRAFPFHPVHARRMAPELKARFVECADRVALETVERFASAATSYPCRGRLEELSVPILLLNGLREKPFQPDVPLLRQAIPRLSVVDIDCGHSPNFDQPVLFNDSLRAFLEPP